MGADKILQLLGGYRALNKLKLIVEVTSINHSNVNRTKIKTISVFDKRTNYKKRNRKFLIFARHEGDFELELERRQFIVLF